MSDQQLEMQVLAIVRQIAGPDRPLTLETKLGEGGLELDSVGTLELILSLEGSLGVRLRDEDLSVEALKSVGTLICHIRALTGGLTGRCFAAA